MRILVEYIPTMHPPLLRLSIFDAPHRRMHDRVIQQFRQVIFDACVAKGVPVPIEHPIDLSIIFINPSSPDLGNLYLALERALDGGTWSKKNAVLIDDSLVSKVTMSKFFPNAKDDK